MYTGFQHVWRTKNNAGDQDQLETNCAEFTTPGDKVGCGDWAPRRSSGAGNPGDLTRARWAHAPAGFSARSNGRPRTPGTLWASTTVGRVFIIEECQCRQRRQRGVHEARLALGERAESFH